MNQTILSLKQIRIIEAIARFKGFAMAADHLNMSQSVISRSIKTAEKNLNISIFQRGWGGAEPTNLGEIVVQHCIYALAKIADTQNIIATEIGQNIRLLPYLKWHHLQAIAAVTRFGGASSAAQNLPLKQPAISRTINAVAQHLNSQIFTRSQQGLTPTSTAWRLTALYDELQKEADILPHKLSTPTDESIGRVAIGMLPFSAQDLVAKAFGHLANQHPLIRLKAVSGDYNMLVQALRHGEIDCIIGMLRQPSPHQDLRETYIYSEQYALIAHKDHPCNQPNISAEMLQNQHWICAPYGTPVRDYMELFFKNHGLTAPTQTCEIHSFTNAEQMIVLSDSIALLSYSAQKLLDLRPELKAINIQMPHSKNTVGLTHIAAQTPTKPMQIFENFIRQLV